MLFDLEFEAGYPGFQLVPRVVLGVEVVRVGAFAQTGELSLEVGEPGLTIGFNLLQSLVKLLLKLVDAGGPELGVHGGDEVLREVEHPVQVAG